MSKPWTSLVGRCSPFFTSTVRRKGADYFYSGRVRVTSEGADRLTARVLGRDVYRAELELRRAKKSALLLASCTCPHFDGGALCKHLWALIEEADERGWGDDAARSGGIEVAWDSGDDADRFSELGDDDDDDQAGSLARRKPPTVAALRPRLVSAPAQRPASTWEVFLASAPVDATATLFPIGKTSARTASTHREVHYGLNAGASDESGAMTVDLFQREMRVTGEWGVLKPLKIDHSDLEGLNLAADDRRLLALILGGRSQGAGHSSYYFGTEPKGNTFSLSDDLAEALIPDLARTGRFTLVAARDGRPESGTLVADEGAAWATEVAIVGDSLGNPPWHLEVRLKRGSETLDLSQSAAMIGRRFAVIERRIVKIEATRPEHVALAWRLGEAGGLTIPDEELGRFVEAALENPSLAALSLPQSCGWRSEVGTPAPRLSIIAAPMLSVPGTLVGRVTFGYGGRCARPSDSRESWACAKSRLFVQRDREAESRFMADLSAFADVNVLTPTRVRDVDVSFRAAAVATLTESMTAAGWVVEAEGRRLRTAGSTKSQVTSGIDWFDVEGSCEFEGESVDLPTLLSALRDGQHFVRLGDGTLGLLPAEWLRRFSDLADFGLAKQDRFRFTKAQGVLLDTLLEELPETGFDERFREMRSQIRAFSGVKAKDAPAKFHGELRAYQREGLGWLNFLAEFGFGGCLADDMGLGKTIQVLALLQERATADSRGPSLIVVPRSLVHNWRDEARRFAPDLRVLDFSTAERHARWSEIPKHDVVLTTYAILRSEIERLRTIRFDYCVLDEAQAIKNATSQVAKAARLLVANNRLAMSGTPVENHLGELGSIFEFLNPGMLSSSHLAMIVKSPRDAASCQVSVLAKALRPFILRRTKEQVLTDLPPKTEQTIFCELEKPERKLYDELRLHYRVRLTKTIGDKGLAQSKIHVLEALLRLRQAACHPGLIDPALASKRSAKLDALMEKLLEVTEAGHKALVFSQFTSLLALVKQRLDAQRVSFEYLDGRTRDRQSKVERFQTSPDVRAFLISLKAGGVGLNLTAADYCFILDPWWNPAAEAQAIDRAHRIGQSKHVFAYRFIARDTVEEKILALQASKRQLADAIVTADNSVIRGLSLEDVEALLS